MVVTTQAKAVPGPDNRTSPKKEPKVAAEREVAGGASTTKEATSKKPHKLVQLEDMTENCAVELLLPLAAGLVEKGKVAYAKVDEVVAIARPKVEPVVKFIGEQHAKHPEVVRLVVSAVALIYGGCFFKLSIMYATFNLAGTQQFFMDLMASYKGTGTDVVSKMKDTLRKSDPSDLMKLLTRLCWQFCAYAAVLNSSIATAVVLAIFVEEKGAFLRPLLIAKVKPMVDTEEMQRWIPFAVKVGSKIVLAKVAYFFPQCVASLLFAYEGGVAIAAHISTLNDEPLSEMTTKTLGGALAVAGTLYQYLYGFAIDGVLGNLVYWIFYPVFLVESFLL